MELTVHLQAKVAILSYLSDFVYPDIPGQTLGFKSIGTQVLS